ncbi:MAG: phosphatidylglycerophosphatase A [Saprospiraceae bacterium]|nr:phosphatidylglycerophosphatase A [Saprospiraceae bacterium]
MNRIPKIIATFGGVGYLPLAPGTWGSLLATLVYLGLGWTNHNSSWLSIILILLSGFIYFIGVWAVKQLKEEWGNDPSRVVIDEACGIFVTFIPITFSLTNAFLGFILFRIFDIWKPFGIRKIDQMEDAGGHHVMLDDVAAGIYSAVVLWAINLWL